MIWIFFWFVVSAFILGVFGWSVRILLQQKAAWKAYAKKMNLSFRQPRGWLVSPVVTGALGSYSFALFSEAQPTEDSRGQRFNTILEFGLSQSIPAAGAIGTARMLPFLETMESHKSLSVQDADWDANWGIRTDNPAVVEKYLTQARRDVLKKVFRLKILAGIFIFSPKDMILRVETSDPLNDLQRLEKIVKGMMAQLAVLVPAPEERENGTIMPPVPLQAPENG